MQIENTTPSLTDGMLEKDTNELVKAFGKTGELQRNVALSMHHRFTMLTEGANRAEFKTIEDYKAGIENGKVFKAWFALTGNLGKGVAEYKKTLQRRLQDESGLTANNAYKVWQRIQEQAGKEKSESDSSEADKSCDTVTMKELATILRRIQKAEQGKEYMPKSLKALEALENAFVCFGSLADVYKD